MRRPSLSQRARRRRHAPARPCRGRGRAAASARGRRPRRPRRRVAHRECELQALPRALVVVELAAEVGRRRREGGAGAATALVGPLCVEASVVARRLTLPPPPPPPRCRRRRRPPPPPRRRRPTTSSSGTLASAPSPSSLAPSTETASLSLAKRRPPRGVAPRNVVDVGLRRDQQRLEAIDPPRRVGTCGRGVAPVDRRRARKSTASDG